VLAGSVRFEAGLFAAALGMIVVSLRSGTVQTVLQQSNGDDHVFVALAAELLILAVVLGALWAMLWIAGRAKLVRPVAPEAGAVADGPPAAHGAAAASGSEHPAMKLAATAAQAVVTAIIMMFLCQSQAKYQALASLAIASTVGTIVAYHSFPTRPSVWFWTGPLLVGFFGYILAASGQDSGIAVGNPQGMFAALARPLPVDYASVGTAGAIWGYWIVRKRQPA
jgi:FtsH-binding integral membrane protein